MRSIDVFERSVSMNSRSWRLAPAWLITFTSWTARQQCWRGLARWPEDRDRRVLWGQILPCPSGQLYGSAGGD